MGGSGWQEQWARVCRWRADLSRTYAGRSDLTSTEALDHAYAFFVSCDHMADWLGLDDQERVLVQQTYAPLAACKQVAEGRRRIRVSARHAGRDDSPLRRTPRSTLMARPAPTLQHGCWFTVTPGESAAAVPGGGHSWDALDLADACLDAWRTVLGEHHLTPPT